MPVCFMVNTYGSVSPLPGPVALMGYLWFLASLSHPCETGNPQQPELGIPWPQLGEGFAGNLLQDKVGLS